MRNGNPFLCLSFAVAMLLLLARGAAAYTYIGGDWGGRDLLAASGDSFSGIFTNIGILTIPADTTAIAATPTLAFHGRVIEIYGTIDFTQWQPASLTLSALESLSLHRGPRFNTQGETFIQTGSIPRAASPPAAGSLTLGNGSDVFVSGGGTASAHLESIVGNSVVNSGSLTLTAASSSPAAVPVPATLWLLTSGLAGLLAFRQAPVGPPWGSGRIGGTSEKAHVYRET